jgi:hypothetical protein
VGKSLDLIISFDGQDTSPSKLGAFSNECIWIESVSEDGSNTAHIVPVERVAFTITLANKPSPEPPREIGYKTIMTAV